MSILPLGCSFIFCSKGDPALHSSSGQVSSDPVIGPLELGFSRNERLVGERHMGVPHSSLRVAMVVDFLNLPVYI